MSDICRDSFNIVTKLNDWIRDNSTSSQQFVLEYHSDGYNVIIEFLGSKIWISYEDEREWIKEKNDYEPLEDYLKREINKMIDNLNLQKFV